jgi:hypothetical protein
LEHLVYDQGRDIIRIAGADLDVTFSHHPRRIQSFKEYRGSEKDHDRPKNSLIGEF